MQAATSADAYKRECALDGFLGARLEIYICQGIQLVHRNVDVVAADASGEHCDSLACEGACDGMELATLQVALFCFEMACHQIHAAWIAYEDNFVSQLLGTDVKMEYAAVLVDD